MDQDLEGAWRTDRDKGSTVGRLVDGRCTYTSFPFFFIMVELSSGALARSTAPFTCIKKSMRGIHIDIAYSVIATH